MSINDRFERYVGYPGGHRGFAVDHTEGNVLVAPDDERFIDFMGGWCVVNAGYGRDRIIDAQEEAAREKAYVKPVYIDPDAVDLAERLAGITPGDLQQTFRVPSGTEAVEMALKAARLYTRNSTIVSHHDAYHGHAFGALSAGHADMEEPYRPVVPDFTRIAPPIDPDDDWYAMLDETLDAEDAAAYITETVLTHQGVHFPPDDHYDRVREICDRHGTLLILDEVANGFARPGTMFAADHYDAEPDILTLAKGLSSGYAPIGAAVMTPEVGNKMAETGKATYSTFGWTPEAVAAAQANLDVLEDESLAQQARETGSAMKKRLEQVDGVSTVWQRGMIIGVELDDAAGKAVRQAGVQEKVLVGTTNADDTMLLSPPLNITEDYVKEGVQRLARAISRAE